VRRIKEATEVGQVDFAYDAVARAGIALSVSIFADREDVRGQMRDDAVGAGLFLRECGSLEALLGGAPRPLGEAVLLDCPSPAGAALAALSRIDERAARSGAQLVVSTTLGGLEEVFACLSQSGAQILVNARRADRIVALGQMLARVPNLRMRELSEEDRLALLRLTEQVGQIADRLDRLGSASLVADAMDSPASAFQLDRPVGRAGQVSDGAGRATRPSLPDSRLVRRIIRQRRLRARFFDGELFADPAWDMLLDLTAARVERSRVSVTSLCIASAVPPTTALRWISQLTDVGLFERVEDETDRRRAFIQLTDRACDAMARYFAELGKQADLPVQGMVGGNGLEPLTLSV
jgi:hypothetical protein